jgi:hypothetical protein
MPGFIAALERAARVDHGTKRETLLIFQSRLSDGQLSDHVFLPAPLLRSISSSLYLSVPG